MALTAFISFQVKGLAEVEAAATKVASSFSSLSKGVNSAFGSISGSVKARADAINAVIGEIPHAFEEAGHAIAAAGHEMERAFTIPITLATAFAVALAKLGPQSKEWEAATGRLRAAHQQLGASFQQLLIPVLNITTSLLRMITPLVAELAKAFQSLSPAMQGSIIAGIALTAALGPILRIGGALVLLIGNILAPAFIFLARQVVALAAAFVTGEIPILGWVALFVAVAAGAAFVYRHLEDVSKLITAVFNYAIDTAIVHLADLQLQMINFAANSAKFLQDMEKWNPFFPDIKIDWGPTNKMIKDTQALHDQFAANAKKDLAGVGNAWHGLRTDLTSDISSITSAVKGAGASMSNFLAGLVTGGSLGPVAFDPGALKASAELMKKYRDAVADAQVQTSIFGMSERDAFVASKLLGFGLDDIAKLGPKAGAALATVFGQQFDAQKFKTASDAIQKAIDDTTSKVSALGMGERDAFINSGLLAVGLDKIGDPALADKVKILSAALGHLFDQTHLQDGQRAITEIKAQIDALNVSARQGFIESWLAKIPPDAKDARDAMEKLANQLFDLQRAKPFESAVQGLTDMRFKIEDVYTALHDGLSNVIVSSIKNVHNWSSAIKALGQSIGDALLKSLGDTIAGGITGVLTGRSGTGGLLGGLLNKVLNSIGLGGDDKSGIITPGGGFGKGISGDAQGIGGTIKGVFDTVINPFKTIFGSFVSRTSGIFGAGGQFLTGLGKTMTAFLAPLGNLFNGLLGGMNSLFNGLLNGLGSVLNSLLSSIGGGGGGLLGDIFGGIGSLFGIGGGGSTGKGGSGGGFWGSLGGILSGVLGFFGLANGGDQVVTRPTLFLTGERGPEKVSVKPLGLGSPAASMGSGGHLGGLASLSRSSPLSRLGKTLDAGGQHVAAAEVGFQPVAGSFAGVLDKIVTTGQRKQDNAPHPQDPSSFAGMLALIASRQPRPVTLVMGQGTVVDGISAPRFARNVARLLAKEERRLV